MTVQELLHATVVLENDHARLEPLSPHHFSYLLPVALQPEVWRLTQNLMQTPAHVTQYLTDAVQEREAGKSYPFAIYDKQLNAWAGSTRYGSLAPEHGRLEIGWTWLGTAHMGTGLNRACKHLLLRHTFEVMGMNRVELKTGLLNTRSQAAMSKLGFVQEGTLRQHMRMSDGTTRDTVYFSVLASEWPRLKETVFKDLAQTGVL